VTSVVVYAYPWDIIGDPGAFARLRELGADAVALAVHYHSVRAATPQHPAHRVVEAEHAALYLDPDERIWLGARLRPARADAWAGPAAARAAAALLRSEGFSVRPWLVLTHNSLLGATHRDLTVRDAYGTSLRHALCPAQPEVRAFAARLALQAAHQISADLVIEAAGPLGMDHLGAHEKTSGADWTRTDRDLLSICFCEVCSDSYDAEGVGVRRLSERVRAGVGTGVDAPEEVLGADAAVVLDVRRRATRELVNAVSATARAAGGRRLSLHAEPRVWATGAGAASPGLVADIDVAIYPAGAFPVAVANRAAVGVAAFVSGLPGAAPWPDLTPLDEVHVYHLGLVSARRHAHMAAALG
jgi:hypothetical protein